MRAVVPIACILACSGTFEDPLPECEDVCVGESGLVRITRAEYRGAVETAFGSSVEIDVERLPVDRRVGAFTSNAFSEISERDLTRYFDAARRVAAQVEVECDECGRELYVRYAPILFRRPADDPGPYVDLFAAISADAGREVAIAAVIETMLQSPLFLYRSEAVPEDAPGALDGYAIANRLASFLWASVPDPSILDAAATGELDDAEGVARVAGRMLDDPRSRAGLTRFHREWLELDTIEGLDPELADAMRAETTAFVQRVFEDGAQLRDLLTDSHAPNDPILAEHYGVELGVDVPGRAGILTQGAFLSAHGRPGYTQPIPRGVFVRTELLCLPIGDPPPGVFAELPAVDPELPAREKLTLATSGDRCTGCHEIINPLGFAFERFDHQGRPRDSDDEGRTIDASGEIIASGDVDGRYRDLPSLMRRFADSEDVQRCMSEQWFRFAMGRAPAAEDERSLAQAYRALHETGSLRDLILELVQTQAFRHRRAPR